MYLIWGRDHFYPFALSGATWTCKTNFTVEWSCGASCRNLEILKETYKYFSFLSKIGHSQRSSTRGKMWNLWYSIEKKLPNNNVDENVSSLEGVLRSI